MERTYWFRRPAWTRSRYWPSVRPRTSLYRSRSPAVQQLAPGIFGRPVLVPPPGEYVADGAARQAAWALSGADGPPAWDQPGLQRLETAPARGVRERYAEVRGRTDGQ